MTPEDNFLEESAGIISEIESNLQQALQKRREEVERALEENIHKQKEAAEAGLAQIEREFENKREALKEFRSAVADIEKTRQSIQEELQGHFELAMRHQRDIENLTAQTLDELRTVNNLSLKLGRVWRETESKLAELRTKIRERFGLSLETAEHLETPEMVADLEREIQKLVKIKDLLEEESAGEAASGAAESATAPVSEPSAIPEEAELAAAPPSTELRMPEIARIIDELIKKGE
jgi:chromosome segregation ATPase